MSLEDSDSLVSPCLCDGSVRWVHRRCLSQWRLMGTGRQDMIRATRCELCGFEYVYELEWTPRSERVQLLLCHTMAIATPLALAAIAVSALTSDSSIGPITSCALLGIWAGIDALPCFPFGERLVISSLRRLLALQGMPPGAADAQAEAAAQAKARSQAGTVACQLAIIRSASNTPAIESGAAPNGASIENDETEIDDEVVVEDDDNNDPDEVLANAGMPSSGNITAARIESFDISGPMNDAASSAKPFGRNNRILIALLFLAVAVSRWYFGSRPVAIAGCILLRLLAAVGTSYALCATLLLLVLTVKEPAKCKPRRGMDGFYVIKSLSSADREQFRGRLARP